MATLSGQTIQSTYQGLLKLETSTTGVTSTLQTIEDGLGNDLPGRVSSTRFQLNNFVATYPLKQRFYGNGIITGIGAQQGATTANQIQGLPFYDPGLYSYSAITYSVGTATTTSDVVEIAFYSAQPGAQGIFPYERVGAVQTLSGLTTTGIKTVDFTGGTISFSATGSGYYFMLYRFANAGVQPTLRFQPPQNSSLGANGLEQSFQGYVQSIAGNALPYQYLVRTNQGNRQVYTGTTTFNASYTYSGISASQSGSFSIAGGLPGFVLHTNDY